MKERAFTVAGIIAEFNPFHNGHAALIQQAKLRTNCDYVLVIMSGNFVQDGTPAITDKYTRTRQALLAGADVVYELPVAFATASAERFAYGAVFSLLATGAVDTLCFGCETENISLIQRLADLLLQEPDEYRTLLRQKLANGSSFPAARQDALISYLQANGEGIADELTTILSAPNAILGIEYCKALLQLHSDVRPIAILRQKTAHGKNGQPVDSFASATVIRDMIRKEGLSSDSKWCAYLPDESAKVLLDSFQQCSPVTPDALLPWIKKAKIDRQYAPAKEIDRLLYDDFSQELMNTFMNTPLDFTNYDELVLALKSRGFTQTRIQRALLHLLLRLPIPTERFPHADYLRLIGFRKDAQPLMQFIRSYTEANPMPIITKVADYKGRLTPKAQRAFEQNLYADAFYHLLRHTKEKTANLNNNEFTASPIIL